VDERRDEIEDESDSAAAAFEELRAEASALRGAIDAISAAVHESGPPDYAPTLGTIVKAVQGLETRLAVIEGRRLGEVVAPIFAANFSSSLTAIQTGLGYECRNRNHEATGKTSAHWAGLAAGDESLHHSCISD